MPTDRPRPAAVYLASPSSSSSSKSSERRAAAPPLQGDVAGRLADLYREMTGSDLPVGLHAWDGSHAGPGELPVVMLDSPEALRRLLWSPNELGLAQAYVMGEIDVEGEVAEGLRRVWAAVSVPDGRSGRSAADLWRQWRQKLLVYAKAVDMARQLGVLGLKPPAPMVQARLRGRRHTRLRDRAAIAHHYDLSNDFYQLVLDPSMAYSCAYWTSDDPDYTLADAQRDKLDLICRKLELRPGMRLLDVGCGWGALLLHAAQHYGVTAVGVTLSQQQLYFINRRVTELGLGDRVTARLQHFRDISEPCSYDAIATIEMGEHVGAAAYPAFTAALHDALEPGGRLLVQQMSRAAGGAPGGGPFVEAFIAPDMRMRPLARTVALWQSAGFEISGVEAMREHYVRTVHGWIENFESRWDEAVRMVGHETARVWRLYLAGGALAFEQGRMGVDQILAVKPTRAA